MPVSLQSILLILSLLVCKLCLAQRAEAEKAWKPDKNMKAMIRSMNQFYLQQVDTSITYSDIDDNAVKLSQYKGNVVYLYYWFIGCAACKAQEPDMKRLISQFENDSNINFVSICIYPPSDKEVWKNYIDSNSFKGIQLVITEEEFNRVGREEVFRRIRADGFPAIFVVNRQGKIVAYDEPAPYTDIPTAYSLSRLIHFNDRPSDSYLKVMSEIGNFKGGAFSKEFNEWFLQFYKVSSLEEYAKKNIGSPGI